MRGDWLRGRTVAQGELLDALGDAGSADTLQSIIPYLLDPLQYTPSAAVFAHFQANLSALLCVMRTCRSTGRMPRWRGQILDLISRLWVQLEERKGVDDLSSSGELALNWDVECS